MEQTFRKFVIDRVVAESDSIKSFYLVPADGAELVPYRAGQYLPVKVAAPVCGKSWVRLYTISDYAPAARHYRLSVKREAGGSCSAFLHDHAVAGTTLAVASPAGSFCFQESAARPVVLIAGGVGVTPVLAMAKAILQGDSRFDVHAFYGVRDGAAHAFKDELARLSHEHSAFHLCTAYSRPRAGHDRAGIDFDHEGRINIELVRERLGAAFAKADYYVCGPSAMIGQMTAGLNAASVSADRIHTESFLPSIGPSAAAAAVELPLEPSGTYEGTVAVGAEASTVTFSRSGLNLPWDRRAGSLLRFAESNGVTMMSGCLVGDCGLCETRLVRGQVEYIHSTATVPSPGTCLPCSCTPKGPIEMDA